LNGKTNCGGIFYQDSKKFINYDRENRWVWRGNKEIVYTMKDAYCKVLGVGLGQHEEVFQKLWKVRALPASLLCAWRVMINRLPTRDNLVKIDIPIESNLCVFCNEVEENVSHLLFTCKISYSIWKMCENWLGVQLVHHFSAKNHFEFWAKWR